MDKETAFSVWAARLCLGTVAALGLLGMYFGNVRFAPIAAGFAILAAVCYADRRGRRLPVLQGPTQRPARRPSLSSEDAPRLSPRPPHSLGS